MKKPNFDFSNLKHQAEEQPLIAVGVLAAALTAVSKLMDANTNRRSSKTWDREVQRRAKKDRSK